MIILNNTRRACGEPSAGRAAASSLDYRNACETTAYQNCTINAAAVMNRVALRESGQWTQWGKRLAV